MLTNVKSSITHISIDNDLVLQHGQQPRFSSQVTSSFIGYFDLNGGKNLFWRAMARSLLLLSQPRYYPVSIISSSYS
jgi:hypothetical protein